MCRSIKPLYNFDPPATKEDVRAAALQFVRKISGYNKPSQANSLEFESAVNDIASRTEKLLDSLQTSAPLRKRSD